MICVYNNENNISNFTNDLNLANDDFNEFMNMLYDFLLVYNIEHDQIVLNNDQDIFTESDLKCFLYKNIHVEIQNRGKPIVVHTELADKILINEECNCIVDNNAVINEEVSIVRSDLTLTYSPSMPFLRNNGIQKEFTLSGTHIDIELKYIRGGFSTRNFMSIRKDLCKLKCLVNGVHLLNADLHGETVAGISIVLFESQEILMRYLNNNNQGTLQDDFQDFQNFGNLFTLLMYKRH